MSKKKTLKELRKTARPAITKHPVNCKYCGHDMGLSRVKRNKVPWTVRCNNCKTDHEVSIKFPDEDTSTPAERSPRLEGDTGNVEGREELD